MSDIAIAGWVVAVGCAILGFYFGFDTGHRKGRREWSAKGYAAGVQDGARDGYTFGYRDANDLNPFQPPFRDVEAKAKLVRQIEDRE